MKNVIDEAGNKKAPDNLGQDAITPITNSVKMPQVEKSKPIEYPFDKLKIGESFGVKDSTAAAMASPVTAENRKGDKHYFAKDVSPKDDPDDASVRVFRNK